MLFTTTGHLREDFYILGLAPYPLHLLDGLNPALFDGGPSCAGRIYIDAIKSVLGDRQPALLFLTHAHWDHCGAVSHLKKAFPDMKIAASPLTAQILKRENALAMISKLNKSAREMVSALPNVNDAMLLTDPFVPFDIDVELEDGQTIDLGEGVTVEALATPGHTRDHMSFYLPGRKILIAAESSGCLDGAGNIITEFASDYENYMASLRRIANLPVEILCQGHRIVFVGREEVNSFFEQSIGDAVYFKTRVCELLIEEKGSIEQVVQRIKEERYDIIPGPKQPLVPYLLNVTAQVKHLAAMQSS